MDQLCTIPGSKDSLDYMRFTQKLFGGYWQYSHRKIGDAWLKAVCKDFCMFVEGSRPGWGRARVNNAQEIQRYLSFKIQMHPKCTLNAP